MKFRRAALFSAHDAIGDRCVEACLPGSEMVRQNEIRDGEVAVDPPPPTDAGLLFIGRIRTPRPTA